MISILAASGALAVVATVFLDRTGSPLTFVGLALPFGVVAGVLIHVALQCARGRASVERRIGIEQALGLAVFASVVSHFLGVHFAFSISATNTYFWVFAGLLVALRRHDARQGDPEADERAPAPEVPRVASLQQDGKGSERYRTKKGARRAQKARRNPAGPPLIAIGPAYLEVLGIGFMVAVIFVTLTMAFFGPQVPTTDWVAALFVVVWLVGLALALAGVAPGTPGSDGGASGRVRATVVYSFASLGGSLLYWLLHTTNLSRWGSARRTSDNVVAVAAFLADDVAVYVSCLTVVTVALAAALTWSRMKGLPWARSGRLWLHLLSALAIGGLIWFKNVDVVRADVYFKEADRYRLGGLLELAPALHEKALSLDSDEEFYYVKYFTALHAIGSDVSIESGRREFAREEEERVASEARRLGPYNADTVAQLGVNYLNYFDRGVAGEIQHLENAVVYLRKAVALAPSDVRFQEWLARAYYSRGETQAAIDQLQASLEIDEKYYLSWSRLADYRLSMGDVSASLEALRRGLRVVDKEREGFQDFIEDGFENRVKAYASAGQLGGLVDTILDATSDRVPDGLVPWVIGRAYTIQGEPTQAVPYFEEALPYLERAKQLTPGDAETLARLAQLYQALGRREEALQTLGSGDDDGGTSAFVAAFELGVEFVEQGLHSQAAEAFEKALASNDRSFAAHKNLGMMYYYNLDRREEGVAHFERALELDPGNSDAPLLRQEIDQYRRR